MHTHTRTHTRTHTGAASSGSSSGNNNIAAAVAIPIVLVVVIAGVAFVWWKKRKDNNNSNSNNKGRGKDKSDPATTSTSSTTGKAKIAKTEQAQEPVELSSAEVSVAIQDSGPQRQPTKSKSKKTMDKGKDKGKPKSRTPSSAQSDGDGDADRDAEAGADSSEVAVDIEVKDQKDADVGSFPPFDDPELKRAEYKLVDVDEDSEEYEKVTLRFKASINGLPLLPLPLFVAAAVVVSRVRCFCLLCLVGVFAGQIDDYSEKRIKQNKRPLLFRLVGVQRIENAVLKKRFEACQEHLSALGRKAGDRKARDAFHGTSRSNIAKICRFVLLFVSSCVVVLLIILHRLCLSAFLFGCLLLFCDGGFFFVVLCCYSLSLSICGFVLRSTGLLRIGHPLNPSKSVDDGYFGSPQVCSFVLVLLVVLLCCQFVTACWLLPCELLLLFVCVLLFWVMFVCFVLAVRCKCHEICGLLPQM